MQHREPSLFMTSTSVYQIGRYIVFHINYYYFVCVCVCVRSFILFCIYSSMYIYEQSMYLTSDFYPHIVGPHCARHVISYEMNGVDCDYIQSLLLQYNGHISMDITHVWIKAREKETNENKYIYHLYLSIQRINSSEWPSTNEQHKQKQQNENRKKNMLVVRSHFIIFFSGISSFIYINTSMHTRNKYNHNGSIASDDVNGTNKLVSGLET